MGAGDQPVAAGTALGQTAVGLVNSHLLAEFGLLNYIQWLAGCKHCHGGCFALRSRGGVGGSHLNRCSPWPLQACNALGNPHSLVYASLCSHRATAVKGVGHEFPTTSGRWSTHGSSRSPAFGGNTPCKGCGHQATHQNITLHG